MAIFVPNSTIPAMKRAFLFPLLTAILSASTAWMTTSAQGVIPPNDLCANITPEALPTGSTLTFTGDNTNATFAGDSEPGTLLDQYPFPNTWHAFTTTDCADVTVSYCATDSGWSNVWKLLTRQCPADTLINPSVMETTTCANGNWSFRFNTLPAGTYYLPVPNVGFGQGGGAYTIEVSAAVCGNLPPANDLCSNVTPENLSVGGTLTFTGDNTNATFAGDSEPGTLLDQYPFPNTWHAFTTMDCADVTVSYCATDSGWSNVWKLLTRNCPADTLISPETSDTTTCVNGNWTFRFNTLPAGTYYLPVPNVGFGQGGGAYSIAVTAVQCIGTGIAQEAGQDDWSIFPNPGSGTITLMPERSLGAAEVELIDMTGRTVYRETVMLHAGVGLLLPLSTHAVPGTYLLAVIRPEGRSFQRLILR